MKLYKFKDYEHYKKEQVKANVRKLDWTWIQEDTISKIKNFKPNANKILCHGVRNAKELEFFSKRYFGSEIIGTEISHTAKQFQNVVEWDFHEVNEQWKNNFDIVYSNSWDHSYDPIKSLKAWGGQLSQDGLMFVEHGCDAKDNKSRASDPLEIEHNEIIEMINNAGLNLLDHFMTKAQKDNGANARVYVIGK